MPGLKPKQCLELAEIIFSFLPPLVVYKAPGKLSPFAQKKLDHQWLLLYLFYLAYYREDVKETGVLRRVYGPHYPRYGAVTGYIW